MSAPTALSGIIYNLPEAEYHARPELSSTGARKLLQSPAKFRHMQENPEPGKTSFDLGTAVHTKVLGTGAKAIAYPAEHLTPSGNVSTKAATVEWAEAKRAEGLVPIAPDAMAAVDAMAEAVLADAANVFEQDGHAEASLFATDPDTGVDMRARFDYFAPVAVDLKTTSKLASPSEWPWTVYRYGYDVQQEWYQHVRRLIEGDFPFVFVVVETEPPYLVGQYQLDREFVEMGAGKARRALEMYARCIETGVWPRYPRQIQLTAPPMPAVYDYQDNYS